MLLSCSNLSVCIEDFDPLSGHEQINFSCGSSVPVRTLHRQEETSRKEVSSRCGRLINSSERCTAGGSRADYKLLSCQGQVAISHVTGKNPTGGK